MPEGVTRLPGGDKGSVEIDDGAITQQKISSDMNDAITTLINFLQPNVEFEIGSEDGNAIEVIVTVTVEGGPPAFVFDVYLAEGPGPDPAGEEPSGGLAVGGPGVVIAEFVPNIYYKVCSNENGEVRVLITHTGARIWHLNVVWGQSYFQSDPIVFT